MSSQPAIQPPSSIIDRDSVSQRHAPGTEEAREPPLEEVEEDEVYYGAAAQEEEDDDDDDMSCSQSERAIEP